MQLLGTLFLLLLLLLLLLPDFQSTKTLSFHNRSSLNFAHTSVIIFSTIAPCRIFKSSRSELINNNEFLISKLPNAVSAAALQQHRRGIQKYPHGVREYNSGLQMDQRRSVAAWDDTWRIEMKCAFPDPQLLQLPFSGANCLRGHTYVDTR